ENVVYTAVTGNTNIKTIICAIGSVFYWRQFVSVFYLSSVIQEMIALVSLIYIKISRDNHWNPIPKFMCFFYNELGTFLSGLCSYVVEVRVEKKKLKTGPFLLEQTPCANTWKCCIPAFVRNLGVFR